MAAKWANVPPIMPEPIRAILGRAIGLFLKYEFAKRITPNSVACQGSLLVVLFI
jgi:hypothetical protein